MAGVYSHRGTSSTLRYSELLEQLKHEFDMLEQELVVCKAQRDEYELKFQQQLQEMGLFQQAIIELDRQHQKVKQTLEEANGRLQRELDAVSQTTHPTPLPTAPVPAIPSMVTAATTGTLAPLEHGSTMGNGNAVVKRTRADSLSTAIDEKDQKQKRKNTNNGSTAISPGSQSPRPQAMILSNNTGSTGTQMQQVISSAPGDFDPDIAPQSAKREGSDWMLVHNNKVQKTLNLDLAHNLDHGSVVCCIKFSNDSRFLATGCNRTAQVFDVQTGHKIGEFTDSVVRDGDLYIRSVCFSPDGTLLATGAEDKQIRVYDIKKNTLKHVFSGHEQDIYSLDFSKDGMTIVSGSGDHTARLWDLETGKEAYVLRVDDAPAQKDAGITSVIFSPDGRYIAAGSLDRLVRVWEAKTGQIVEVFEGHIDSVYSVAFSPDGRLLVSGSLDRTLKLWDFGARRVNPKTPACRLSFTGHKDFVLSVGFSPDGKWIVSGSKDRTVQFWDPNTGTVHSVLQGHKNSVISISLSSDCQYVATGSGDLKARIWKYTS